MVVNRHSPSWIGVSLSYVSVLPSCPLSFLLPSEHDRPQKGWHKQRLCQSSYRHSADNHHHGLQRRKRCACFSFSHNQESLGIAPLCWFGNPYRFRQAMSFSWLKPNALQNQLSRSPLRCFQWLMKSTIWSRTDTDTHCTFNSSPQSFFLTQYVQSATRQSPHLFEIISILGYQLLVDDCVLVV